MSEQWRPVVGFEDLYEVSDEGNVRRSAGTPRAAVARILRPGVVAVGYEIVVLSRHDVSHTRYVHQLVAEAFIGPRPAGLDVNHKDGDRTNNVLANLEYCTRSENNLHGYARRRRAAAKLASEAPFTSQEALA